MLYESLKKLSEGKRKPPMHIYKDEKTGQIIEEPLRDTAASALINEAVKQYNQAKSIHDFMFH